MHSPLRDQLRSARADYQAVRYPGNLAAESLPERRRINVARWALVGGGFGIGSLAAAAAIALALVNFLPATKEGAEPSDTMFARLTGGGPFGSSFSQLPAQLTHLTTVIPVETFRTTLHLLGLPPQSQDSTDESTKPPPSRDAAAA